LFLIGGTPAPLFEVIERGGSYAAPLALALLQYPRSRTARAPKELRP
jgi:hypothetical protein